jgi:hypothetical protein
MCWLVADGNRVDKGFKNSHYNRCAKVLNKRFHVNFNGSQISNHVRTWRTRWNTIVTLKKLSSTHFNNDETGTIMLDEKNYLACVQVCIISPHSFLSVVTITPKSETSLIKETSETVTESSSFLCPDVYYLLQSCMYASFCIFVLCLCGRSLKVGASWCSQKRNSSFLLLLLHRPYKLECRSVVHPLLLFISFCGSNSFMVAGLVQIAALGHVYNKAF